MAVILKFRQVDQDRSRPDCESKATAKSDGKANTASADIVIFPGIRVDYGPVEAALGGNTASSQDQGPDRTGPSGRRAGKRRKA